MAKDRGLPASWLNDQASSYLPSQFKPAGKVAFEGGALRVVRAEPDLMLAMKVSAVRTGDRGDIRWLAEHLSLSDPDEIVELTERVMRETLRDRQREEVHTMFGEPNLGTATS